MKSKCLESISIYLPGLFNMKGLITFTLPFLFLISSICSLVKGNRLSSPLWQKGDSEAAWVWEINHYLHLHAAQSRFDSHAFICQWITDMPRELACSWKCQTWDPATRFKTCLLINIGGLLEVLGTQKNLCEESCAAHIVSHIYCTNPVHWILRNVKSPRKSWNFRQLLKLSGAYCFQHDKWFLMNRVYTFNNFKSHI